MSYTFDPQHGLIIVQAEIWGPVGYGVLRLALDTGATSTTISQSRLIQAGYDPAATPQRYRITTGSGVEYVPVVSVRKIAALGQDRAGFPILAHTLPPSASVDGLLGLDFLRGQTLKLDFRTGQITLS